MSTHKRVNQMSHLKQKQISDNSCKAIIIDTILEAIQPLTPAELSDEITSIFHILISTQRLEMLIDSLVNAGIIVIDSENHISIVQAKKLEYVQARLQETTLRQDATRLWIEHLQSHNEIPDELEHSLSQALPIFLRSLFVKHGVSCYELLTTRTISPSFDLHQISVDVSEQFEESNQKALIELLPTIFHVVDIPKVAEYIKHGIDKAVGYISEVISPENMELISSALKNLTLYLDTNTLYRLLNLQGQSRYDSIRETLNFCIQNGVKLKVSAETKKELSARLSFDAKVLLKYPTQVNLARVGYNYRTTDNYVSTYWKQTRETQISVDDFIEYYKNFDILLEPDKIDIEEIKVDEEALIERARSFYERLSLADPYHEKSDAALWHDAYNLAYIQKMQRVDAKTSIETGCLFLTTDQSLATFQREDHELKEWPPIVIIPSQLLQLFSFSKPDSGYEETFIKFFASSSLGVSFQYSNNDIQEILSRIGHYKGIDSNLAERILARELVNSRYLTAETDGEREEIVYNSISEELLAEVDVNRKQVAELTSINSQLSGENLQLFGEQKAITELMKQNEERFFAEKEKMQNENEQVKSQLIEEVSARKKAEERERQTSEYSRAQEALYVDEKWEKWKKRHYWLFGGSLVLTLLILVITGFLYWRFKETGYFGILGALTIPAITFPIGSQVFSTGKQAEVKESFTREYREKLKKY